jgi:acyl transferase domain-containing protein
MDVKEQLERIEAMMRKSAAKPAADSSRTPKTTDNPPRPLPVAIVGIAGSFPRCATARDYWQALRDDVSLIGEIPEGRLDALAGSPPPDDDVAARVRWAGLLERPYGFDAAFFGVPEHEAALMDPRQRLLLMCIYHCLEDAGYAPSSLRKSSTALFVGVEDSEYAQTLRERGVDAGLTNAQSMIANGIAYHFEFAGASEFINTMCSSGAVALHRACMALRSGEVSQAVVAAANILVRAEPFWQLAEFGQLSAQPTVGSFGHDADGYLRADGVASVLLKTLPQAERDGDEIYAVIRGSSVNFNGQGAISMAAPHIPSHVNLIKQCYRGAGVAPRDIDYIEAQGMGTPVSDIAEWEAFNRALTELAREQGVELTPGHCGISTVKPFMGHMHAASAFGALFKILSSLHSDTVYRIRGLQEASPDVPEAGRPCALLRQNVHWPRGARPRLAGLHSFGLGGNNAHLLIEEYRDSPREGAHPGDVSGQVFVLPFSARSPAQCRTLINQCSQWLQEQGVIALRPLAHTLQTGRDCFAHRVAFLAASREELSSRMAAYLGGQPNDGVVESGGDASGPAPLAAPQAWQLAWRWVRGEAVAWPTLWPSDAAVSPPRLRLPGYPFELQDYRVAADFTAGMGETGEVLFEVIDLDGSLSRLEKVQRYIVLFVAQALDMSAEDIDPARELQEFGFDSMVTVRLLRSAETQLGVKLSVKELRDVNTIGELARHIEAKMAAPEMAAHAEAAANEDLLQSLDRFKRGEVDLGEMKRILVS